MIHCKSREHNLYGYVHGDPLGYVDPDGRIFQVAIPFVGRAISGSAIGGAVDYGIQASLYYARNRSSILSDCVDWGSVAESSFFGAFGVGKSSSASALNNASISALKAADKLLAWTPQNKHLLDSTAKRAAKFNTNSVDDSFRVVTDLGRAVGAKG